MTPIHVANLYFELQGYPNKLFVFLISGLLKGFDIGYDGPQISIISSNMKSARDNPEVVRSYLAEEISLGRIFGPFDTKPFPNFRSNPIGVVPKKETGKFRIIMNLNKF